MASALMAAYLRVVVFMLRNTVIYLHVVNKFSSSASRRLKHGGLTKKHITLVTYLDCHGSHKWYEDHIGSQGLHCRLPMHLSTRLESAHEIDKLWIFENIPIYFWKLS
jgi:hypothetical protein